MENGLCYAGIGSRETPLDVLAYFEQLGQWFAANRWTLRSGHADGADKAFENGCNIAGGSKEIYIPWKGFNSSNSELTADSINDRRAYIIAAEHHPHWNTLKETTKKLMVRNVYQVLGKDLTNYSKLIVCWTKGGTGCGGTGQAIRIAETYGIPVIDAGKYTNMADVSEEITRVLSRCA